MKKWGSGPCIKAFIGLLDRLSATVMLICACFPLHCTPQAVIQQARDKAVDIGGKVGNTMRDATRALENLTMPTVNKTSEPPPPQPDLNTESAQFWQANPGQLVRLSLSVEPGPYPESGAPAAGFSTAASGAPRASTEQDSKAGPSTGNSGHGAARLWQSVVAAVAAQPAALMTPAAGAPSASTQQAGCEPDENAPTVAIELSASSEGGDGPGLGAGAVPPLPDVEAAAAPAATGTPFGAAAAMAAGGGVVEMGPFNMETINFRSSAFASAVEVAEAAMTGSVVLPPLPPPGHPPAADTRVGEASGVGTSAHAPSTADTGTPRSLLARLKMPAWLSKMGKSGGGAPAEGASRMASDMAVSRR